MLRYHARKGTVRQREAVTARTKTRGTGAEVVVTLYPAQVPSVVPFCSPAQPCVTPTRLSTLVRAKKAAGASFKRRFVRCLVLAARRTPGRWAVRRVSNGMVPSARGTCMADPVRTNPVEGPGLTILQNGGGKSPREWQWEGVVVKGEGLVMAA